MGRRKDNVKQTALQRTRPASPVQGSDRAQTIAALEDTLPKLFGVHTKQLAYRMISQLQAMQLWGSPEATYGDNFLAAIDAVIGFRPSTVAEAMLAVQMYGVHEAALRFLNLATLEDQTPEARDANVLRATRLMRLFIDQLEAMAKLKGKTGQQKVVVEHVTVNQGGQAIVGAVTTGNPGQGEGGR